MIEVLDLYDNLLYECCIDRCPKCIARDNDYNNIALVMLSDQQHLRPTALEKVSITKTMYKF